MTWVCLFLNNKTLEAGLLWKNNQQRGGVMPPNVTRISSYYAKVDCFSTTVHTQVFYSSFTTEHLPYMYLLKNGMWCFFAFIVTVNAVEHLSIAVDR